MSPYTAIERKLREVPEDCHKKESGPCGHHSHGPDPFQEREDKMKKILNSCSFYYREEMLRKKERSYFKKIKNLYFFIAPDRPDGLFSAAAGDARPVCSGPCQGSGVS